MPSRQIQGQTQNFQRILLYTFSMVLLSVSVVATTAMATKVTVCDHSISE
jgi:hypothetical protein